MTSQARNLSQEFLDSMRGLGQTFRDDLQTDDPAQMLPRLTASAPARPDIPPPAEAPRPRANVSANRSVVANGSLPVNAAPDETNGTAAATNGSLPEANGNTDANGSAEAALARFWGSSPPDEPYSSSP